MHAQQGISAFSSSEQGRAVPSMPGIYLGQVIGVLPNEHAVNVILPSLSRLEYSADRGGLKVVVMSRRAGTFVGEVDLPRVGELGVVVFLHGSHQYPVWLGSVYQTYAGLSTDPAGTKIDHHDSGVYERIDPQGNVEWSHPSGCYLRVGDGTTLTPRTRKQREPNTAQSETVPYAIPSKPIPTVHLSHPSGTTVTIDPAGHVTIESVDEVTVNSVGKVTVNSDDRVAVNSVGVDIESTDSITINGTAPVTLSSDAVASVKGTLGTLVGDGVPGDFVVLKAAIDQILTIFNAHKHSGGGNPPTTPLPPWTTGVSHTQNTKAL